jgi:hypothetical protein
VEASTRAAEFTLPAAIVSARCPTTSSCSGRLDGSSTGHRVADAQGWHRVLDS